MSQYFIFVNLDKKEYIKPKRGAKLWEICAYVSGAGILAYLLADGEKDGTPLMDGSQNKEEIDRLLKKGWKIHHEGEISGKRYWVLEKETKYFGHWSGDRIVVAGDYGHSELYETVQESEEWKNITEEAYKEFYDFLGFESETGAINPDIIITAESVAKSPKLF